MKEVSREEIKAFIIEKLEFCKSIGESQDHLTGELIGMMSAFRVTGVLGENDDLLLEIYRDVIKRA